jgi:hypothetical protein
MRMFRINVLFLTLCNSFFKGRGPGIYSRAFFVLGEMGPQMIKHLECKMERYACAVPIAIGISVGADDADRTPARAGTDGD